MFEITIIIPRAVDHELLCAWCLAYMSSLLNKQLDAIEDLLFDTFLRAEIIRILVGSAHF